MYGNIIGDLAGSIYEYGQIKKVSRITIDKLITEDSFISDDTIDNIKELIILWLEDYNFECINNCNRCRKYNWCACDAIMLTMSYLQNGEYYG